MSDTSRENLTVHADEYLQRVFRAKEAPGVKWEDDRNSGTFWWFRGKKDRLLQLGLLEEEWIAAKVFGRGRNGPRFERSFNVRAYGRTMYIRAQKNSDWITLIVHKTDEELRQQKAEEQKRKDDNELPKTPEEWKSSVVPGVDLGVLLVLEFIHKGAPRYLLAEEDYRAIVEKCEHLKAAVRNARVVSQRQRPVLTLVK